jgi:hypothetical protein
MLVSTAFIAHADATGRRPHVAVDAAPPFFLSVRKTPFMKKSVRRHCIGIAQALRAHVVRASPVGVRMQTFPRGKKRHQ